MLSLSNRLLPIILNHSIHSIRIGGSLATICNGLMQVPGARLQDVANAIKFVAKVGALSDIAKTLAAMGGNTFVQIMQALADGVGGLYVDLFQALLTVGGATWSNITQALKLGANVGWGTVAKTLAAQGWTDFADVMNLMANCGVGDYWYNMAAGLKSIPGWDYWDIARALKLGAHVSWSRVAQTLVDIGVSSWNSIMDYMANCGIEEYYYNLAYGLLSLQGCDKYILAAALKSGAGVSWSRVAQTLADVGAGTFNSIMKYMVNCG